MSLDLAGIRSASKAREAEERRLQERRRSTLVLILRHLCDQGYIEAYERLAKESSVDLSKVRLRRGRSITQGAAPAAAQLAVKQPADGAAPVQVDVADNVDLLAIVQEYEEGFEAKYGRRPRLVRQLKDQVSCPCRLPRVRSTGAARSCGAEGGADACAASAPRSAAPHTAPQAQTAADRSVRAARRSRRQQGPGRHQALPPAGACSLAQAQALGLVARPNGCVHPCAAPLPVPLP